MKKLEEVKEDGCTKPQSVNDEGGSVTPAVTAAGDNVDPANIVAWIETTIETDRGKDDPNENRADGEFEWEPIDFEKD